MAATSDSQRLDAPHADYRGLMPARQRPSNEDPSEVSAHTISHLLNVLGPALVAVITGAPTLEEVLSWASGTAAPAPAERQLLLDTVTLVDELLAVDDASVVRAWFMGMNPQLDDCSPAEVIAEGRSRDAAAAAHTFIQGGWS